MKRVKCNEINKILIVLFFVAPKDASLKGYMIKNLKKKNRYSPSVDLSFN